MATAASLVVKLLAETADFHAQMRSAASTMEETTKRIASAASSAATVLEGFLGIKLGTAAFGELLAVTEAAQQAQYRLEAVIRASGDTAGLTARQIEAYSHTLANSTLFNHTQIEDAAAALATFGNIHGAVFTKALSLSTDLSTVMGTDLHSAIVMIGKALNDPAVGMTNLQRIGVQFTATQKETIKGFLDTNDLAGAQAYIIQALTEKFGGAGSAANQGLSGSIQGAKKAYDDFLESLGRTQQTGTVIGTLGDFFKSFFRNRELTTDPLEDLRIQLDNAQSLIERLQQAKRTGLIGAVSGDLQGGESVDQAITRNQAIVQSTQARIKAITDQRDAEDKAAAGKTSDTGTVSEHTKAIEQEIARLNDETLALQLGAKAAEIKKLADQGATQAELNAASAAFDRLTAAQQQHKTQEETDQNTRAINDQIDALKEQVATYGLSDEAITIYELAQKGATDAQIQAAMHLEDTITQQKLYDAAVQQTAKDEETASKKREELMTHALKNVQDGIASLLTSWATSTESMGNLFLDFTKRIVEAWLNATAQLAANGLLQWILSLAGGSQIPDLSGLGAGDYTSQLSNIPVYSPSNLTAGAAGGVTHVVQHLHFNIQAVDAPSVAKLLETHGSTIANVVLQATRQSSGYRLALLTR